MLNINFIENYRKKKRLSKGEFSKMIGLKQSNYSMLLRYKTTTLANVDAMARCMKVSAKRLIED